MLPTIQNSIYLVNFFTFLDDYLIASNLFPDLPHLTLFASHITKKTNNLKTPKSSYHISMLIFTSVHLL